MTDKQFIDKITAYCYNAQRAGYPADRPCIGMLPIVPMNWKDDRIWRTRTLANVAYYKLTDGERNRMLAVCTTCNNTGSITKGGTWTPGTSQLCEDCDANTPEHEQHA